MKKTQRAYKSMTLNILNRINQGYDHLEPVILGLMAMNKSFMLIGRHGTGKTRLALELIRRMVNEGIKVWIIDITGQYEPMLERFIDTAKQNQADLEIQSEISETYDAVDE